MWYTTDVLARYVRLIFTLLEFYFLLVTFHRSNFQGSTFCIWHKFVVLAALLYLSTFVRLIVKPCCFCFLFLFLFLFFFCCLSLFRGSTFWHKICCSGRPNILHLPTRLTESTGDTKEVSRKPYLCQ